MQLHRHQQLELIRCHETSLTCSSQQQPVEKKEDGLKGARLFDAPMYQKKNRAESDSDYYQNKRKKKSASSTPATSAPNTTITAASTSDTSTTLATITPTPPAVPETDPRA
jgi:hypothetical protein